MDGTRDQPPGKNAENWSRRDGIRAGAVSGPWRSAPRAGAPQAPQPPSAAPEAALPRPPMAAPPPPSRPHPQPRAAGVPARRRTQAMVAGIVGGVIGALGLILTAYLFRPDAEPAPVAETPAAVQPAETAAAPPAAGPAAVDGATEPAPPPARAETALPLADPALATVTSVRLRVGPGFPADRQQEIVAALAAAGLPGVQVEALPFAIANSRVGYYRPEDLPAAEALGRIVGPVAGADGAAIGVRDYGQLLADATPGRLDLWIGD